MNSIIVAIVYAFLILVIRSANKDYISKIVLYLFTGYWCISLFASTFSPYGLYPIPTFTYLLLLAGTVSFVVGMCSVKSIIPIIDNSTTEKIYINSIIERFLSNRYFLLLFVFSIVYLYKYALVALAVAATQGYADVYDQLNLIFLGNSRAQMIYGYLLTPLFHVSLVLVSYYFLNLRIIWRKYLLNAIIYIANLFFFVIIGGGRSTIVIIALYLLITYICITPLSQIRKLSLKKVVILAAAVIGVIYLVSLVSNYRNTGHFIDDSITASDQQGQGFELLARYSILPFELFNYGIEHDYLSKFGYQFGKATLMGFDNWIYIPLKVIGVPYETSYNIVTYLEETWIPYDSSGTNANYAYTGLMYHYLDFGYVGIILFPFIFGLIFSRIINSFNKKSIFSNFLLLSFCFFLTMHSVFTCYLIKGWTGLYFIILLIFRHFEQKHIHNRIK